MSDVADLALRAFKRMKMFTEDRQLPSFRKREAVEYLNLIIKSLNNSDDTIPYISTLNFSTVANQRTYKIGPDVSYDIEHSKPINIEYVNITHGNIVYIVEKSDANTFYTSYINNTTKRRPTWFFEKEAANHGELIFFELPDQAYNVAIEGRFAFSPVTCNGDLDQFPGRFLLYLELELTRNLQTIYPSQTWTDQLQNQYMDSKNNIKNKNAVDLSVKYRGGAKIASRYNNLYRRT